jgi:hypothetical protein
MRLRILSDTRPPSEIAALAPRPKALLGGRGSTMESQAGDSLKAGSTVDRGDRSLLALLEIGAAAILVGSLFVPWYARSSPNDGTGMSWGGSAGALTTADLLIPFATLVAVVVTLAGLAFPDHLLRAADLQAKHERATAPQSRAVLGKRAPTRAGYRPRTLAWRQ